MSWDLNLRFELWKILNRKLIPILIKRKITNLSNNTKKVWDGIPSQQRRSKLRKGYFLPSGSGKPAQLRHPAKDAAVARCSTHGQPCIWALVWALSFHHTQSLHTRSAGIASLAGSSGRSSQLKKHQVVRSVDDFVFEGNLQKIIHRQFRPLWCP